MPNKTIYVAEEDLAIFQKAQDVAGESISKVIVQALRQYVIQKDLEGTDFRECEAWKGSHEEGLNIEKNRFIGKRLSEIKIGAEDGYVTTLTLYFTRKSKFLLQTKSVAPEYDCGIVDYDYEIIDDFSKLYTRNLPDKLIKDAEEQLGKAHIRFLDI